MIGYLSGKPMITENETLLMLCHGVGYEVSCAPHLLNQAVTSEDMAIWIYTQVREDAIQLYGFGSQKEKQMFLSLIKVNGVGPKSALQILSASTLEHLYTLINAGDAKGLSQLPKVGKKTAEQIILTLKGKLVLSETTGTAAPLTARKEITSALVNLGFRLSDVEKVVNEMPPEITLEGGIRQGLASLTT